MASLACALPLDIIETPQREKMGIFVEVLKLPQDMEALNPNRQPRSVTTDPSLNMESTDESSNEIPDKPSGKPATTENTLEESSSEVPEETSSEEPSTTEEAPEEEELVFLIRILKLRGDDDVVYAVRKVPSSEDPATTMEAAQQEVVKRQIAQYDEKVYDEKVEEDQDEKMAVAETIIFRPLFSYRHDSAARRRSSRDVSRSIPTYDYDYD